MWDRFSAAEMARRHALARGLMDEHELAALLVFGNSGVARHNEANVFWLTNHLDLHHAYYVLPRDESREAALLVGLVNHVPNAREVVDVPRVEWGGYDPAATIAARLRAAGVERGRVGLVGVNATFSMGMPHQHRDRLLAELPHLELVEATRPFQRLRLVKSDEEVAWLERAAAHTDRAIEAVHAGARPGMSEAELVALAEDAYRPAGGLPHITFLRSMPMDAPTGCVPAQNPSGRRLVEGDVVITEFSASHWGYSGQIQRPIFLGREPTPAWRELFEVARACYERLCATVREGASEAAAVRAARVIPDAGFAIYDDLLHGFGVDIMPPIVDRTRLTGEPAGDGMRFERNMAVVLQPNPITPDERMGLQLGGLTVVEAEGARPLHHVPLEPLVAGT